MKAAGLIFLAVACRAGFAAEVAKPLEVKGLLEKKAWEESVGGKAAAREIIRNRLRGWPKPVRVDGKSLPRADRDFLLRIAADTWRGLDAFTDRYNGLPVDRVEFGNEPVARESARVGDYTSGTNIGFSFLAVTAAYELELISRDQAVQRLALTLATLDRLETYQGFFFNHYDTTVLGRTSDFVSFVDSAWLTAGLIVTRRAFPELAEASTRLIEQGDYRFFYDAELGVMSHGYDVRSQRRSRYHYGVFYTESRLGSLIAIGKGDVPETHWFRMARTFPPEVQWQARPPLGRTEKMGGGFRWIGGHYRWRGQNYVPSWGGSLFEALMPRLLLDEKRYAPDSLGRNGKIHAAVHRLYALEYLGYRVWGMSPSSAPRGTPYSEYGVRLLGVAGYKSGIVSPHAAALALLATPVEATANLRTLAELYPLYGDFGFFDSVDPRSEGVSHTFLYINQAMTLVALANHLQDHAIQKLFISDSAVQRVLPLLAIEEFDK